MQKSRTIACLVFAIFAAGCSSSGTAPFQRSTPVNATVNRAASLAFGTHAKCGQPGQYQEYTCTEHPPTCGVQTNGWIDGSVANAGCWQTICDVELGVATSHGEKGTKDFYDCERDVAGCSSMTGGCPTDDVCITGHGRKLAVDYERTAALPDHGGGEEFSCPYHDEDYPG